MVFGRLERAPGAQPMSDINMTPLVDVMLVLVVILIITAPLLASSIKLDLPRTVAAPASTAQRAVLVVLDPSGQAFMDDQPVDLAQLAQRLQSNAVANPQSELQLRADVAVPYGRVAQILALAQQAGLNRIGFVTDTRTAPGPGAKP